jgi:glycosyltransferase involved in cell wall biosynthesis
VTFLRIAQVSADRGIDPHGTKGASQHLRGVAAGLADLGHHVRTFTARPTDGTFPTAIQRLDALATTTDIDVVYERLSLGHRAGLDHARRLGVPFVLEVNAPLVDEAERHRPDSVSFGDRAVEIELLRDADLVISVATELTGWIETFRTGPALTQPNGFEPSWFPPTQRVAVTAADVSHPLVFLGHPKPWHGADRIVSLLVELATTGHRPNTLVIGGGAGAEWLLAAADRHGVAQQLTVTGALGPREATQRLADAVIGLAPYPAQTPFYFCPLKIVDYLAAGLAVVSTHQGDIAQLVGDAGIVIDDPDDDHAFAAAVRTLLDDDERRCAMARSGRARANESMTWRDVAAATADAVVGLVQRTGAVS